MAFIYDLTDTWNAGGTAFNAIKMNVTDTASAAASRLLTLQVGGAERFSVDKAGIGTFASVVRAAAGSTGAPAFSFGSDTNTGMWSPSADAIAFSTAGSERLRVDSSGRVVVGATSVNASAQLEVTSTTRGFLPPRMTTVQRDAIATPPDGLVVYNTTIGALEVRQGGVWVNPTTAGVVNTPATLDTDFTNEFYTARRSARTFAQLIDFTRTTAGTFVGSNGLIQNTPASVNLLTFTQEFDNAFWSKGPGVTVTANAAVAPDGTSTADNVSFAAGGASEFLRTLPAMTVGQTYVYSIYIKLVTGTPTFTFDVGNTTLSAAQTPTSEWQRFTHTFTFAGGNQWIDIQMSAASTLAFWGAQLEAVPDANLVLGSDRVTNGDFASGSTGWTLATGWAVASGEATFTANGTNAGLTTVATSASTAGKTYRIQYTVVANTLNAGTLRVGGFSGNSFFGASVVNFPTTVGTNVAYVYVATPSGTGTVLDFFVQNTATSGAITIDNISVKEITGTVGMPTTYTRNVGGVFPPRFDFDPLTLAPRGLLVEEQRTNLLTYSNGFTTGWVVQAFGTASVPVVTSAFATSPDGTQNAARLQMTLNGGTTTADYAVLQHAATTVVSGASYAYSIWLKSNTGSDQVVLARDDGASGTTQVLWTVTPTWQRFTYTATTNTTSSIGPKIWIRGGLGTSVNADILIYGAQLEAGAFATSYIPTVASQVTRTADVATITGQNFSQWYNQSEGTLVAEWLLDHANSTGRYIVQVNSPTVAQGLGIWVNANGIDTRAWVGATSVTAGNASSSTPNKAAFGYRATDNAVSLNGAAAVASSATGPTDGNLFSIGFSGVAQINGHIRRITYYPTRLSNAQLQALTV
jgi:hypothetical protein